MSHRDGTGAPRPIVAGVDGSAAAVAAARWAADEAVRGDLPLRLLHAVSQPALAHSAAGLPDEFSAALESDGRGWLGEGRSAVLDRPSPRSRGGARPGGRSSGREPGRGVPGRPAGRRGSRRAGRISRHSRRLHRGRTSHPRPLPGGGRPWPDRFRGAAFVRAFEEAASRGADLVVVNAWLWFTSDSAYSHARRHVPALEDLECGERDSLAERLDRGREKHPDVAVRTVLARDRAVRCLLEHSADAQLLVVGSQGQGGFSGMVLGPISQALLYHATCPLLVVRPAAAGA